MNHVRAVAQERDKEIIGEQVDDTALEVPIEMEAVELEQTEVA